MAVAGGCHTTARRSASMRASSVHDWFTLALERDTGTNNEQDDARHGDSSVQSECPLEVVPAWVTLTWRS